MKSIGDSNQPAITRLSTPSAAPTSTMVGFRRRRSFIIILDNMVNIVFDSEMFRVEHIYSAF